MKKKIYLVRHTGSIDNANIVHSGHRDLGLTDEGREAAAIIGEELKDKDITLAYTSPLKRCTEGLAIMLGERKDVRVIIEPRLIERSYGILEGLRKDKLVFPLTLLKKIIYRSYYIPPPFGESFRAVWNRVTPFIPELYESAKKEEGNILICAHNNSMRPIRQHFEKMTVKEALKVQSPNGQIFEYEIEV